MNSPFVWHRYRYPLQYRLGEATLLQYELEVQRRVYRLDEIVSASECAVAPALPQLDGEEDGLFLASIPQRAIEHTSWPSDYRMYRMKRYRHCYIDMGQSFAQYAGKFSGKTRSGFNRKVKKFLSSVPADAFRRYTSPEEMHAFHASARVVSARSYQERLLDCGLPGSEEFREEMCTQAAEDNVRAFLLFDGPRPVSYLYCPVIEDVLLFAYLGYDPDYASRSVGTVLQWLAFESLFAEQRFRKFDFTEGESDYKQLFATHTIDCSHLLLLRKTFRNGMVLASHRACENLGLLAVSTLDRLGVKDQVKKWLRQRSVSA
jgi:hypothetical protein